MRAFAERYFALNKIEDGVTYRAMLEGLLERTRRPHKIAEYQAKLACPPFPQGLRYLWNIYHRIAARRGSSGFAANPISWPELDAFVRLSGETLTPYEIELIEMLDDLSRIDAPKPEPEID